MRRYRLLAILALTAGAMLVPAGFADAHKITYNRSVSGQFFPAAPPHTHIQGTVDSSQNRCKVLSRVRLFRVRGGPDAEVGNDQTNSAGEWRINAPNGTFPAGTYYVVVDRKVLSTQGSHRHVCPRLETNTVTIGDGTSARRGVAAARLRAG